MDLTLIWLVAAGTSIIDEAALNSGATELANRLVQGTRIAVKRTGASDIAISAVIGQR